MVKICGGCCAERFSCRCRLAVKYMQQPKQRVRLLSWKTRQLLEVRLIRYNLGYFNVSILWYESKDLGSVYYQMVEGQDGSWVSLVEDCI
ncbi:uncharacterized protein LOC123923910 isoform X2 [Trifolium pratense]|uniref:uncharacterized protein LOC123923910 isoform X2 n=1 Tax=Trifolium pratense TaxID=57577 RepID=UPI001E69512D|nr:uncharacterized protein LOC123923910 isoform X2 [Trifolium pratense]